MESECATILVFCIPSSVSPVQPTLLGCKCLGEPRETCTSPGNMMCLFGGEGGHLRNTACHQTWLCFPERS